MGEIDYIYQIHGAPGNQIRYRILTDRGQVLDFVVQYEMKREGKIVPVVRYDGSHGQGHRDILNRHGQTIDKRWLPSHMSMNECLDYGSDDLRSNWRQYRNRFLEQDR